MAECARVSLCQSEDQKSMEIASLSRITAEESQEELILINSERWLPFPGLKLEELHTQRPYTHEACMATENM